MQHIDAVTETWTNPPHRSHLCASCGHTWRPADMPTEGVRAIETKGKADSPLACLGETHAYKAGYVRGWEVAALEWKSDAVPPMSEEQRKSLECLNQLCTPSYYLDRLGPIRDWIMAAAAK